MGSLRQIGAGFLLGVLSIAAVLGGFALSQAEAGVVAVVASPTASSLAVVTVYPTIPLLTDTPRPTDSALITDTPSATSTLPASLTPPPPPVSCLPPAGWMAIQVQGYDTLASLAQRYQTTPEAIKQGNCLFSDQLVSGSFLYVPPRPTATFVPCGAPYGWVNYIVVPGDTLYSISARYRVTVADLQRANCLGSSTFIASGKPIKVPHVATSTSSVQTPTWTASPTLEVTPPTLTSIPPAVATQTSAAATQAAAAATQTAIAATQTAAAATQAAVDATQTAAAATQASVDATAAAVATQASADATAAAAAATQSAAATQTVAAKPP